jgi:subtilisin-like proprotein convertase family protein
MKKLITVAFLIIVSLNLKAQTFSWTGNEPIFDNETDTIPISVAGLPNSIDTLFGIAHICIYITHTYDADLFIRLVSPNGVGVTLIDNIGGDGNNFTGTCMGMDGTHFSDSQAPFTGLFEPVGNVASFNNGQNPNGTWLLIVSDQANADTGSTHSASIAFTNNPPQNGGGGSSGPTGNYVWPGALCPGGTANCDLLPDMTSSAKEILLHHNETPGFLYISNATPNIGYGPIDIYGMDSCFCGTTYVPCGTVCPGGVEMKHVVKQRIFQKVAGTDTLDYYDRIAGLMTYHSNHGHLHVDNWAYYTLRTATSNPDATTWPIVGTGTKQSFCLVNLGTCNGNPGECTDNNGNTILTVPNQNLGFHTGCGLIQGIYPGHYDVYSISLNDPIPLNNVCNGNYYIVSITDPNNDFLESDETNNWVAVPITLTQQSTSPAITPQGPTTFCPGDSVVLTGNIASNYSWSTGETTQSIVVRDSGSYTFSTTCGSSVATSPPINVSLITLNSNITPAHATLECNGDPIELNATANSGGFQNVPVTFTSNTQVFIPDNNSTGVVSPIAVTGINPATLNANSVVSVKLNLTHTYDGDLLVSLVSPSGNTVILSNRRGGSGNNFTNTIFSMSANTLIANGAAPFTGTYKPDGNFSALTGNVNGTWLMKVQDLAGVDTGRIQNWSIILNNAIPETIGYSWTSIPPGFTSTSQNINDNPTTSTTYYVAITSSSTGCTENSSYTVTVPPAIAINNFNPVAASPGAIIDIQGNGFVNISSVTVAGLPATFNIINSNQLEVTVPNATSTTGLICITSNSGCNSCSPIDFMIDGTPGINLKVFIEGYYIGNGLMNAVVDPFNLPLLCDTMILELRHTSFPYATVHSLKHTINTSGTGRFTLPPSAIGNSYYVVVKHRNAIETWSANPLFITDNLNLDFTNAINKAYGNNLRDLHDGNFAMWSGDISDVSYGVGYQDQVIEGQDYSDMENALLLISTGYVYEDITGDGVVEGLDYSIMENNVYYLIMAMHP